MLSSTDSFPHIPHTDPGPRQAVGQSVQQTVFAASVQRFNYFSSSLLSSSPPLAVYSVHPHAVFVSSITFGGLEFEGGSATFGQVY